jgi:hypothetical protein
MGRFTGVAEKVRRVEELETALAEAQQDLKMEFESATGGIVKVTAEPKSKVGRARKPKIEGESKTSRKNPLSLTKLIPNILAEEKDGVTPEILVKKVLKSGYDSSAKDFHNVVYQTLRKLVRKGEEAVEIEVEEGSDPRYTHPANV